MYKNASFESSFKSFWKWELESWWKRTILFIKQRTTLSRHAASLLKKESAMDDLSV